MELNLMDSLKALIAQKRKEKEEEFEGKKYVRRGEIEEKRLKRLRDAEEKEDMLKARHPLEKLLLCDFSLPVEE